MTPFVADPDFTLYVGDVLETLAGLPDESVDCVVSSPPYWGLRDYGTGEWEGGDQSCDHEAAKIKGRADYGFSEAAQVQTSNVSAGYTRYKDECPCGARRVDRQIGLEATPDLFVARMVEVFREVRRVLAAHGTCWVNLGDSYASGEVGRVDSSQYTGSGGIGNKKVPILDSHKYANQKPRAERRIKQRTALKPKDLVGIPWRVAFALQADGWYLRSDIIWAKPNPMPESVTDRPTKAHEYIFLLSKQPRYWFDQEAVREPHTPDGRKDTTVHQGNGSIQHRNGERWPNSGRNVRSVWEIATQPYPEAHFATFPEELPRRCIRAGCAREVCRECGKARERLVEREHPGAVVKETGSKARNIGQQQDRNGRTYEAGMGNAKPSVVVETVGWSDCGHNNYRPGVVLDPFMGSGTTALVARAEQRHAIGIELNPTYAQLCARRLSQLSLLAEA